MTHGGEQFHMLIDRWYLLLESVEFFAHFSKARLSFDYRFVRVLNICWI